MAANFGRLPELPHRSSRAGGDKRATRSLFFPGAAGTGGRVSCAQIRRTCALPSPSAGLARSIKAIGGLNVHHAGDARATLAGLRPP
jgi:hypothetical protein